MPSINRIRVNNVKYNYGTQAYDDFSMRMYGRNTLYDLANGGGKSVLMLLLMQNLIPNSTLDDKQPIEKLFRNPGNTVIHSLIEWKLDECDIRDGMRYMTTGFAAKKAATAEEEREDGTAQIEYFNYCIFYREYNKNDIINLPLEKNNERISYKALKNYLHDLSRNDKNMLVYVFDRKGEYQRFIADYGLYESHWEIVRGINKTEGHVRTYFETNYKTTRKVIEDLLIEEIIEKAYQTKTGRIDGDNANRGDGRNKSKTESTVSLLMTIQDELKILAEKKKGIQLYDHEQELVQLLIDRIDSFMSLYKAQDENARECASVYITLQNEKDNREDKLKKLKDGVSASEEEVSRAKELLDILKLYKDIAELEKKNLEMDEKAGELSQNSNIREMTEASLKEKQAALEYTGFCKARQELEKLKSEKSDQDRNRSEANDIYNIVSNIKLKIDEIAGELEEKAAPLREELKKLEKEEESQEKQKIEAETEYAVIGSREEYVSRDIDDMNKAIKQQQDDMDYALIVDVNSSVRERTKLIEEKESSQINNTKKKEAFLAELETEEFQLSELGDRLKSIRAQEKILEERETQYKDNIDKFRSLSTIYAGDKNAEPDSVAEILYDRITANIVRIYELKQELEKLEKREKEVREGRIVDISSDTEKVIEYILTRHGGYAMYAMDYLSALPEARKKEILERIPGFPFGVVVTNLSKLMEDPGLKELALDEEIYLYDKDNLDKVSVILGECVEAVRPGKEYFTDARYLDAKLRMIGADIDDKKEELRSNESMLETLREDMDFVRIFIDKGLIFAGDELAELKKEKTDTQDSIKTKEEKISKIRAEVTALEDSLDKNEKSLQRYHSELVRLTEIASLESRLENLINEKKKFERDKKRIQGEINRSEEDLRFIRHRKIEIISGIEAYEKERDELIFKWENRYAIYYAAEATVKVLEMNLTELETAFERTVGTSAESRMSLEKEKLLVETLSSAMDRHTKAILELGYSVEDMDEMTAKGGSVYIGEESIAMLKEELKSLNEKCRALEKDLSELKTETARVEGRIEYAKNKLVTEYGEDVLDRIDSLGEEYTNDLEAAGRKVESIYDLRKSELIKLQSELASMVNSSKEYDDILRLSLRIAEGAGIDLTDEELTMGLAMVPLNSIREMFDTLIMRNDKLIKDIDRAKADLMKLKMKVYETLNSMNVMELATSIRDDVVIPENTSQAEGLLQRLGSVIDIIRLERDRVEKSIVSMQQLRDSFVDQCVERCLDVRSELDKLTKLSEISVGNDKIQMIRLTIPYVKDEFIKERMSEYIDKVVEEVDKKENDSDRQKYLNSSLAMKKLFSVIVTDMSKIKLMLYKRERIKEQSRYLRYEEAVGSTGQSQGIYIQFLISIINYISGMYAVTDSGARSKTLFIDNPFGAAKDIYIWEPIFKLLEENSCQLIVPARGATPEITGRFDINYVLGQQMTGDRTTTVVVNYSSRTKGEELEYKDLGYEQQSFDFI